MRVAPYILLITASLLFAGCTAIKVTDLPDRGTSADWLQYGGSPSRQNSTDETLALPLEKAWEYDINAGYASYSPLAEGPYLIAGNLSGELHVVNVESGKGKSIRDFGSAIIGAPVVDGAVVYIPLPNDDENLIAYDVDDNHTVWKLRVAGIETAPLLFDSLLYAVTTGGDLMCIEPGKGDLRWTFVDPDRHTRSQSHAAPAAKDSLIVYGRDNGSLVAVNRYTHALQWKVVAATGQIGAPVIAGDTVYAASLDSTVGAFDLRTGARIWKRNLTGRVFASLSAKGPYLYAATASGVLQCMNRTDGSIVWQYKAKNGFGAAPLVAGSSLVVGGMDKTLTVLNARTGIQQWQWTGEARVKVTPILHKGMLIAVLDNRSIVGFRTAKVVGAAERTGDKP